MRRYSVILMSILLVSCITWAGMQKGGSVNVGSVTGTLAVANGGTGQTTASAAINALLPNQSAANGLYLTSNGSVASWAAAGGTSPSFLTATSGVKTPVASARFAQMTTNSITLTAGTWHVWASCDFYNGGTSPSYTQILCEIAGANGDDTGSFPTDVSALSNTTIKSANNAHMYAWHDWTSGTWQRWYGFQSEHAIIAVSANTTIYAVPYAAMSTAANARIQTFINAIKISSATN